MEVTRTVVNEAERRIAVKPGTVGITIKGWTHDGEADIFLYWQEEVRLREVLRDLHLYHAREVPSDAVVPADEFERGF